MFMQGSDLWMFYPSIATGANPYSSIFITKLVDVAAMNWIADLYCDEIHQQDLDLTVYNGYLSASPDFGGDSQSTNAIIVSTGTGILNNLPVTSAVDAHLKSPDDLAVFYGKGSTNPDFDLKFSYSATCSVWARPTPVNLLNKTASAGLSVSADNYTLTQNSFDVNHCQGLTFTYTAAMMDGTPLLAWMWFDPDTITYYFTPNDNALVASYSLSMTATLVTNSTLQQLAATTTANFGVDIIINIAPTIDQLSFNANESLYAH